MENENLLYEVLWVTQNPGAQEEAAARPPAEATASSTIFAPGLVRIPAV